MLTRLAAALRVRAALVVAAARPQWLDEGWQRPGAGRDVLLDIEVQGAMQTAQYVRGGTFAHPDALVMVFMMPPSLELLETRLRRRGTDSDEAIRKRLALAQQEMAYWTKYDYAIVSGRLDDDFEQGKAVVIAEKCRTMRAVKDGKPWQQRELSF